MTLQWRMLETVSVLKLGDINLIITDSCLNFEGRDGTKLRDHRSFKTSEQAKCSDHDVALPTSCGLFTLVKSGDDACKLTGAIRFRKRRID